MILEYNRSDMVLKGQRSTLGLGLGAAIRRGFEHECWEGLASHWSCVTDSVVYPPTGSVAWEREMSTPPKLHSEYHDIFTFTMRVT